jgi:hypothetical protein
MQFSCNKNSLFATPGALSQSSAKSDDIPPRGGGNEVVQQKIAWIPFWNDGIRLLA